MSPRGNVQFDELRRVNLFSLADERELQTIAGLGDVAEAEPGRVLTEESEFQGGDFFVILDGTATVEVHGQQVATLEPGSFFGEMAALELRKRSATVTADSPMRLLIFSRSGFDKLLAEAPTVPRRLLREMGRRLRDLEEQMDR